MDSTLRLDAVELSGNEALLRVGNLAWRVDRYELLDLFSKAGRVRRCEVIHDRFTKRSGGFGFVEMANGDAARVAIAKLNGRIIRGRTIHVTLARPSQTRGQDSQTAPKAQSEHILGPRSKKSFSADGARANTNTQSAPLSRAKEHKANQSKVSSPRQSTAKPPKKKARGRPGKVPWNTAWEAKARSALEELSTKKPTAAKKKLTTPRGDPYGWQSDVG
jgi:RNA recognition motif-containing protein